MNDNSEYYKLHAVCPECGEDPCETTTTWNVLGIDRNRTYCSVCAWVGIVHDLKPKEDRNG